MLGGSWSECNFTCIHISRWCDGIVDCPYGDDETNCRKYNCMEIV